MLEEADKNILNLIYSELSYDDMDGVDKIAKVITSQHIEDWDNNKLPTLLDRLQRFKNAIEVSDKIDEAHDSIGTLLNRKIEIEGMSSLLKNNLESVLDEFSGSVTSKEKADVLLVLLKELL